MRPEPVGKQINVQTLFFNRFITSRNTDHRYFWNLKHLESVYPIKLFTCEFLPALVMASGTYLIDSVLYRSKVARRIMTAKQWRTLRRSIILPRRALSKSQPDVLFTNQYFPRNMLNVPIVFEFDFFAYGLGKEREFIKKILYVPESFIKRASVVCVRHRLSLQAFKSQFPQYSEKARLVPFYLPSLEALSEQQIRDKFDTFGQPKVKLLFVGNLARLKGLRELIAAYLDVSRSLRAYDIEFTVVSRFQDGPVALSSRVTTLSNVPQRKIYELLAECHIFAMPSRRDATGTVFWEAMANGCALLVPHVSPQKEIFGGYGLTSDPTSPVALAQVLTRLITNRALCLSAALRGRAEFLDKYHHSVVGPKYYEIFREVTQTNSGRIINQG